MQKHSYPGKLIVFEGPDGSGHTTQAELLQANLESRGLEAFLTSEPTRDGSIAPVLDNVLKKLDILEPFELQVLFVQDRREHLGNFIIPALKERKIVICDRYILSTLAYGSAETNLEKLIELNNDFPMPDATFVLNIRPELSAERIAERTEERYLFESLGGIRRVAEAYKSLATRFPNIYLMDGERPVAELHREVLGKVKPLLA
ncbi:MAG TPA: dTMP kinase [Candidatus Paceibacterota bacterium]|nr:dTMP kinase [Candidatus Paceibacterota bacterium]